MLKSATVPLAELENTAEFRARHIGPDAADEQHMLSVIGAASKRALIDAVLPRSIARHAPMDLPPPVTEAQALAELAAVAAKNQVVKSFIGQGYHGSLTPGVIARNILENPAWYTAYTPYQAEISQGRLEALVNFQTMVCDLTAMPIANASMLDEATAAAEAMTLAKRSVKSKSNTIVVAGDCHPQVIEVVRTRAEPLGLQIVLANSGPEWDALLAGGDYFAVMIGYPTTSGSIYDLRADTERVHAHNAAFIVCTDLLALTLLTPPGEWGADIVVGNSQRFGVPMGGGGPHAAFMACRDDFKRSLPGRLVGVSVDAQGQPAYRLALQTREQHIRREKATSNICTAQVLLAVIASMYAVYHGPAGLKRIAQRVASYTAILAEGLKRLGHAPRNLDSAFDTLSLKTDGRTGAYIDAALQRGMNLRRFREWDDAYIGITLDETTTREDIAALWSVFAPAGSALPDFAEFERGVEPLIPLALRRTSAFLDAPGLQHAPQRNRDAALHPQALGQGPGAGSLDDPLGLVHDEAQRHGRDDPDHLAGVRRHPPVRAGRAARRLRADGRAVARVVVPGHGLRGHQPAAQRRIAGRVRGAARHPRLAARARPGRAPRVPDSGIGARHQSGERADGGHERGGGEVRRARQRRYGRP